MLQAYFYEDYARRLDELSEGGRIERMIGEMDEVHPGLRQYLETVVTKSWANDPWQKGAYQVYHSGQQEWYPEICKREGVVRWRARLSVARMDAGRDRVGDEGGSGNQRGAPPDWLKMTGTPSA